MYIWTKKPKWTKWYSCLSSIRPRYLNLISHCENTKRIIVKLKFLKIEKILRKWELELSLKTIFGLFILPWIHSVKIIVKVKCFQNNVIWLRKKTDIFGPFRGSIRKNVAIALYWLRSNRWNYIDKYNMDSIDISRQILHWSYI